MQEIRNNFLKTFSNHQGISIMKIEGNLFKGEAADS